MNTEIINKDKKIEQKYRDVIEKCFNYYQVKEVSNKKKYFKYLEQVINAGVKYENLVSEILKEIEGNPKNQFEMQKPINAKVHVSDDGCDICVNECKENKHRIDYIYISLNSRDTLGDYVVCCKEQIGEINYFSWAHEWGSDDFKHFTIRILINKSVEERNGMKIVSRKYLEIRDKFSKKLEFNEFSMVESYELKKKRPNNILNLVPKDYNQKCLEDL